MKIWIINHYATPPDRSPSTRHYALGKELNKYGHDVTVIAARTHHFLNQNYQTLSTRLEVWKDSNIRFIFLPTPRYDDNSIGRLWNMLYFAWQVLQLPNKINADRPDIIIGSSVHLFAVWSAQQIAKHFEVPFCFEVRDLWPQTLIDMKLINQFHPIAIIFACLERFLYLKADRIITLIPYAYEYICKLGIDQHKITYLPNGVELDSFKLESFNFKLPVESDQKIKVMYVGAHGQANGLSTLIEAASELEKNSGSNQIQWYFVGEGPDKKHLKIKAESLALKSVTFEERIPKNQVPQKLSEADILVFHLLELNVFKYGISPNKLFDYLAAGKPIVFASASRNNPVAEAQAGITVPPQNPQAMAEAVLTLANLSGEERLEMGKKGRAYVEKNHSYSLLGSHLNNLLQELVFQE